MRWKSGWGKWILSLSMSAKNKKNEAKCEKNN